MKSFFLLLVGCNLINISNLLGIYTYKEEKRMNNCSIEETVSVRQCILGQAELAGEANHRLR